MIIVKIIVGQSDSTFNRAINRKAIK